MTQNIIKSRSKSLIAIAIFMLSFLSIFSTLDHVGITADESWINDDLAISYSNWFSKAFSEAKNGNYHFALSKKERDDHFGKHFFHPSFGRILTSFTYLFFHESLGKTKSMRLAPALLFSTTVTLLFLLLTRINLAAGIVTAVLIITTPRLYGHAHIYALDTTAAALWVMTSFFFIKGIERLRFSFLFAVTLGLAMANKATALFIPIPLFLWGAMFRFKKSLKNWYVSLLISGITFIAFNPWFWGDPSSRISAFIKVLADPTKVNHVPVKYLGNIFKESLPWHYSVVMIFVSTPLITLILFIPGLTYICISIFKEALEKNEKELGIFLLLNLIAALMIPAMPFVPPREGTRLFLPALLFLASIGGFFYGIIYKKIEPSSLRKNIFLIFLILLLIPLVRNLYNIHPYELSYYNELIGGLKGAKEKGFETTYWGESLNYKSAAIITEKFKGRKIEFINDFGGHLLEYYQDEGYFPYDEKKHIKNKPIFLVNFRQSLSPEKINVFEKFFPPLFETIVEDVVLLGVYEDPTEKHYAAASNADPYGLKATFYTRDKNRTFTVRRTVPTLNKTILKSRILSRAEWTGLINIKVTGEHGFGVYSNCDCMLQIDYNPIKIDDVVELNKSKPDILFKVSSVPLPKGLHKFDLICKEVARKPYLSLLIHTPDNIKGIIPKSFFLFSE